MDSPRPTPIPLTDERLQAILGSVRRRRRRAMSAAVAVTVISVLAVGGIAIGLSRSSPGDVQSVQVITPPTHSYGLAAGDLVLGANERGEFLLLRPGSAASPTVLSISGNPEGPPLIATDPGAGWVVTYSPSLTAGSTPSSRATVRLAVVNSSGRVEPFGPTFPRQIAVTGLAVSPDGSQVAIALFTTAGGVHPARIEVLAMPGHSGPTRSWSTPQATETNEIISVSWSPDGRHLSYIAGGETGGGIFGPPSTLDIAAAGSVAPVASTWPVVQPHSGCLPIGAVWLGSAGRFGAVEDCRTTREQFRLVNPSTGAPTSPPVVLPATGCPDVQLSSLPDAKRVLISWCGQILLENNGKLTLLPVPVMYAAWAGIDR